MLDEQWREPGFTCPNSTTYPWLWLWDSCFHSIVWAELGDSERAVAELTTALSGQYADGFVPHLLYLDGCRDFDTFWGAEGTSSITQPPIYGHTVAELRRRGVHLERDLVDRAVAGVWFLLERRRRSAGGLVELVHPWESGCDHSPRWDDLIVAPPAALLAGSPAGSPAASAAGSAAGAHAGPVRHGAVDRYDETVWFDRKGELLDSVHRAATGSPLWNDAFAVGSVMFTSVLAFCAGELADTLDDSALRREVDDLTDALSARWDPGRRTWIDDGSTATGSGRIRTVEALLPLLVERDEEIVDEAVTELVDPAAFGGEFGPAQVHRDEPTHRRGSYWRGPSWPQLDYLLWVALRRVGRGDAARSIAAAAGEGAWRSGWAEYWDPDDAAPGGAAPQSWSTLPICML